MGVRATARTVLATRDIVLYHVGRILGNELSNLVQKITSSPRQAQREKQRTRRRRHAHRADGTSRPGGETASKKTKQKQNRTDKNESRLLGRFHECQSARWQVHVYSYTYSSGITETIDSFKCCGRVNPNENRELGGAVGSKLTRDHLGISDFARGRDTTYQLVPALGTGTRRRSNKMPVRNECISRWTLVNQSVPIPMPCRFDPIRFECHSFCSRHHSDTPIPQTHFHSDSDSDSDSSIFPSHSGLRICIFPLAPSTGCSAMHCAALPRSGMPDYLHIMRFMPMYQRFSQYIEACTGYSEYIEHYLDFKKYTR